MRKVFATGLAVLIAGALGSSPALAQANDAWLTTRGRAQQDLRERFHNIARVACAPDRSSETRIIGHDRYWQRFWCRGGTYDRIAFRLRYKSTGRCGECWTITNLTGTGAEHLRTRTPAPRAAVPTSGSCTSDYYRNSSGHCIHRPSSDPAGATALCVDGTYSYSEHASGTCSHHGGVARWINHP